MSLVDIKGKPVRMQGPWSFGDRRDHVRRDGMLRCTSQNLYVRADRLARKVN